jgi:recombination protein RecR
MARLEFPEEIKLLIERFKQLPGIGPKGAERIAIWLINKDKEISDLLARSIENASHSITLCEECGFFSSQENGCVLCKDQSRESLLICVVEQPTDVIALEKTGVFKGHYHCLGGKLAPLDNVGPDDLRINSLIRRISEFEFKELILGVGSDVEGEATANYLADLIMEKGIKIDITRLAQGLPAGGGLENADELTLYRALDGRRKL